MSDLTWKYVKPLRFDNVVSDFLRLHNISLPDPLLACITKNNGGRPSKVKSMCSKHFSLITRRTWNAFTVSSPPCLMGPLFIPSVLTPAETLYVLIPLMEITYF